MRRTTEKERAGPPPLATSSPSETDETTSSTEPVACAASRSLPSRATLQRSVNFCASGVTANAPDSARESSASPSQEWSRMPSAASTSAVGQLPEARPAKVMARSRLAKLPSTRSRSTTVNAGRSLCLRSCS